MNCHHKYMCVKYQKNYHNRSGLKFVIKFLFKQLDRKNKLNTILIKVNNIQKCIEIHDNGKWLNGRGQKPLKKKANYFSILTVTLI